jgi:hypothetical protein
MVLFFSDDGVGTVTGFAGAVDAVVGAAVVGAPETVGFVVKVGANDEVVLLAGAEVAIKEMNNYVTCAIDMNTT